MPPPDEAPVVIVGGGPVGLVSSILLSLQHIPHILLERQPDTSIHPKAVGLNQRTVEVFRRIGVEDEVLRAGAPPETISRTAWYTGLGPNGKEICSRSGWGGGEYQEIYKRASPCRYANLAQIRLEPILKRRAMELNPDGIFYSHEVERLEEKVDHVLVHYHEGKAISGQCSFGVRAQYVLGSDGGRFLADQLGITMAGESDIVDMATAHIRAPISQHHPDDRIFLHWFIRPELGGSLKTGYLYHLGPYPIDSGTEEWVFACARLPHEQVHPWTEKDMLERLHRTLEIPDLPVHLISMSHWYVNAKVAERYRSEGGRIFLVGDAAHRIPPWGALGLNSGVQDADNLVWKLSLALRHPERDLENLLQSYDAERRPIGERVGKTSLINMQSHALILDKAIGVSPKNSEEANMRTVQQYFDPEDAKEGLRKRNEVARALKELDIEFYAHGAEVGWFYDLPYQTCYSVQSPVNPQVKSDGTMELCEYRPTTRPGSQLPHAWVRNDSTGEQRSTRELPKGDKLLLLAFWPAWKDFEHPLLVQKIIGPGQRWQLQEDHLIEQFHGVLDGGALIVRPDRIIAFRFEHNTMLKQSNPHELATMIVNRILPLGS